MANPTRQTMGDYYRSTDVGQISLGFQMTSPVTFNIYNVVLASLRDNKFDGSAIRDHLSIWIIFMRHVLCAI